MEENINFNCPFCTLDICSCNPMDIWVGKDTGGNRGIESNVGVGGEKVMKTVAIDCNLVYDYLALSAGLNPVCQQFNVRWRKSERRYL